MSYQALYRTYRPRRFHEVVGQEHITRTLKNQVASGRIGHAYLFCGSRGTGKTSTARILSRAVNCLAPVEGEPCSVCESCKKAQAEDAVDIIELDAASNNGVDDMRALLEKARFTPLDLKYKVYIIDEVHMVTSGAFNALLKTLEEPPAHVVFILATTEPQKLPATVVSRCQRFDFHRLGVADITMTLAKVLREAGGAMDEEGLALIARAADGGMRDALSLADQCLSFCGKNITAKDVYDVLGCMDEDFLFDMAGRILKGDAAGAIRLLDQIVNGGRDLLVFLQDLCAHIRALLLAKACGDCADLLDCTKDTMARYEAQAAAASEAGLLRAMETLMRAQSDLRGLRQPRVLVESALVRLCRPEDAKGILALEDRLARLEQKLASGAISAPTQSADLYRGADLTHTPPQETAPWDDAPLPDCPPKESDAPFLAQPPAPPPPIRQAPPAPVIPAPQSAPAPSGSEGEAVLSKLKKVMQSKNISLFILLRGASRAAIVEEIFTIWFPPAQQSAMNGLNVPRNLAVLSDALAQINAKLQLSLRLDQPSGPVTTEALSDFFGDKFKIED